MLEAGVNVLVQPPGKKVKEIGLLSGGEKALSAMALIFSLFLLNPSPFCVMDEVDAPLDEFSLAAFTTLMSELKTPLAVHRDHAQPAHDAARRPDSRRHDGPPGRLANHLAANPASGVKEQNGATITRSPAPLSVRTAA